VLLKIEGVAEPADEMLSAEIREQLNLLYARVPRVSCTCDRPGQCCELTKEERDGDFATMYPLHLVEYLNILDYARQNLPVDRREMAMGIADERPDRCPFLTGEGHCSIHPARPMACRTYGVLSREIVETTAKEARDDVPKQWISSFLYTERHTCCPHTETVEPEKVAEHAARMIRFSYERELIQMGRDAAPLSAERLEILESTTGREWISVWSWGGFNTMVRSPHAWLREHFGDYWRGAILAE
jgi:Fe-S-cluster containining protein